MQYAVCNSFTYIKHTLSKSPSYPKRKKQRNVVMGLEDLQKVDKKTPPGHLDQATALALFRIEVE